MWAAPEAGLAACAKASQVAQLLSAGSCARSAEPWVRPCYPINQASDLGDGRVLIRGECGGKGVTSGIEMSSSLSAVYTLEHGRISKAEYFFDHQRALKAVGLKE